MDWRKNTSISITLRDEIQTFSLPVIEQNVNRRKRLQIWESGVVSQSYTKNVEKVALFLPK